MLKKGRLYHDRLPADVRELVWTMHIEALRPLADTGELGCVLFSVPAVVSEQPRQRRLLARASRAAGVADRRRVPIR